MCNNNDNLLAGRGEEGFNDPWHVYPTNDLREHILSLDCPCMPILDEEDNIVIHNSFDGREAYERGERKKH